MISIQSSVEEVIKNDAEAYASLKRGILNYSQYAHEIHGAIEIITKKAVRHGSIVIALTRIASTHKGTSLRRYAPMVKLKNITTKLPCTEIVYPKTPETIHKLSQILSHVSPSADDFFVMTLGTQEITLICSETKLSEIESQFKIKPIMIQKNLFAIGLTFSENYYKEANITFSLMRKLALREIVIAETVSSYTEVLFICHQEDLSNVVDAFTK